jgi:hypothetical protein
MVLIYKRSLLKTQWWLGFQPSRPRFVDLVCDFLLTAALNYLPFGVSGCKSRFIGMPPDAGVNVYRCLTNSGISIIIPLLKKIIAKKALTPRIIIL